MSDTTTQDDRRPDSAPASGKQLMVQFKGQLDVRKGEFAAALPAHIPAERYSRVVMTAVQQNPELLKVNRLSLFRSAMQCAQDGLLPDGREAALVPYRDYQLGYIAVYMPMIRGIRKKVRNSKELSDWHCQVVYENDQFEYELGDRPFIRHKPASGQRGKLIACYSVATFRGTEDMSREVMTAEEVYAIRERSMGWKSAVKKGHKQNPWISDEAEMWRKTVARRHSKILPMSTDMDDLLRRDDALYNFDAASDKAAAIEHGETKSLAQRLDSFIGEDDLGAPPIEHDPETGEIVEEKKVEEQHKGDKAKERAEKKGEAHKGDAPKGEPAKAEKAEAHGDKDKAVADKTKPVEQRGTQAQDDPTDEERKRRVKLITEGWDIADQGPDALRDWLGKFSRADQMTIFGQTLIGRWNLAADEADRRGERDGDD